MERPDRGKIVEQFRRHDLNRDGKLDFTEMAGLIQSGNPDMSDWEVMKLFKGVDKNNDGRIDFEEFVEYIFSTTETKTEEVVPVPEEVKAMFTAFCFDEDCMDGRMFVNLCKDCKLINRRFTVNEADIVFAKVKQKGERVIRLPEFERVLCLVAERRGSSIENVHQLVADSGGPRKRASTQGGLLVPVPSYAQSTSRAASRGRAPSPRPEQRSPRPEQPRRPRPAPAPAPAPRVRPADMGHADFEELRTIFREFGSQNTMTGAQFAKLCRDCDLFDDIHFMPGDEDTIFAEVCKGSRKINLPQFLEALGLVAIEKECDAWFVEEAVRDGAKVINATKAR